MPADDSRRADENTDDVVTEAWERVTDEPEIRGVNAGWLAPYGNWSVGVAVMECVRESDGDLSDLQALMDRSLNAAGDHLRSIFGDEHQLTAEQLVTALDGIFEMHLAVVTSGSAPLVAPTDGVFLRGKVWFGLLPHAVRTGLVRRNPRVSASHSRDEFACMVHGTAHEVDERNPAWPDYQALLRELYVAEYGPGWLEWFEQLRKARGSGLTGYIEPRVMFAKG